LNDKLHIVCLDAPSPPDYGGAIDMFYKIKALAETGKKITLHYFDYNKKRSAEGLAKFCSEIYAYQRKEIYQVPPISRPFIVRSRINKKLIERLNADEAPILLEGLHCAGIIPSINQPERIVLRMHNEEASYYRHLAESEKSFIKRKYFKREAHLLHSFQKDMKRELKLACLSDTDIGIFRQTYGFQRANFIPCFIPWQTVSIANGQGDFCLYHGNMSVSENEEAVLWLIENVFSKLMIPFTIAGKGISKRLAIAASTFKYIRLINEPSIAEIDALVRAAHIHVLPSLNRTGVKLKLLNALLNGRFCITNESGVMGSKIQRGLQVANDPVEWMAYITETMSKGFDEKEMQAREQVLALYNNRENAFRLSELWSRYQ